MRLFGFGFEVVVVAEDSVEGGCSGECAFVLLAEAGKGGEDIFDVVAVNSIEEEVGGVELGHQIEALRGIPLMNGRVEAGGFSEGNHIVACAGELQNPVGNPFLKGLFLAPGRLLGIEIRGESWHLFNNKIAQIHTTNLLATDVVIGEGIEISQ